MHGIFTLREPCASGKKKALIRLLNSDWKLIALFTGHKISLTEDCFIAIKHSLLLIILQHPLSFDLFYTLKVVFSLDVINS
jgi:hypothetical protein